MAKKEIIGRMKIDTKLLLSVVDILGCIKKDSSPEIGNVYIKIENNKLFLYRGNRHSRICAQCYGEIESEDLIRTISFEDFVKILKLSEEYFYATFTPDAIIIDGVSYRYNIQDIHFNLSEVMTRKEEADLKFTISNAEMKLLYDNLIVAPLDRNPPVLDCLFIDGGYIYGTDHSIMSRCEWNSEVSGLKPIPPFIFHVANKLSDECDVSVSMSDRAVVSSFELKDHAFVTCMCSYFEGNYPIEQLRVIWDSIETKNTVTVDSAEFMNALKRIKAISKSGINIVNVRDENGTFFIDKEYSEKSVKAEIHHSDNPEFAFDQCKFAIDGLIHALKNMNETVRVSKKDKYLIVSDNLVVHILPTMQ